MVQLIRYTLLNFTSYLVVYFNNIQVFNSFPGRRESGKTFQGKNNPLKNGERIY